jgi:large repetitive protein
LAWRNFYQHILEKFLPAYSDADNDALSKVQITGLPKHGNLSLGGVAVTLDQEISSAVLNTLTYTPVNDYSGLDTVYYKVSDQNSYSASASYFHFVISPANDPPVIDVLETEPMKYDIGRELAQIFTSQFSAHEPENDPIASAVVGFRAPNFDSQHDYLEFKNTSGISGSYDPYKGILTLTGTASVTDYINAIRSITYVYYNLDDIVLEPRTVYVTLSDGVAVSEARERVIELEYEFVELDIPNVFTPDGNNKNDLWRITSPTGLQQFADAVIRVFDKRGRLVFETKGFETPWDGRYRGEELPPDTYFYTVDLRYGNVTYKGSLLILKNSEN